MGTPQFSSKCREGMDVLQALAYMGTVAQAGGWDKSHVSGGSRSVCMMHLTSQTKASHILPPPSHLIVWALQADGFQSCFYLLWFSYQGDNDLQGGTFIGIQGREIDADHSEVEDCPKPRAQEQGSICPGPCKMARQAAV